MLLGHSLIADSPPRGLLFSPPRGLGGIRFSFSSIEALTLTLFTRRANVSPPGVSRQPFFFHSSFPLQLKKALLFIECGAAAPTPSLFPPPPFLSSSPSPLKKDGPFSSRPPTADVSFFFRFFPIKIDQNFWAPNGPT